MTAPANDRMQVREGGADSTCERVVAQARVREGARTSEGAAEGKGGSSWLAPAEQGARARVQARARVTSPATIEGTGATRWIALPAMMCIRPKPCVVVLIGTTPEVVSTLAGLRRGDLTEVEGELTLADLGDEAARLAILVAAVRLVGEVLLEVGYEG